MTEIHLIRSCIPDKTWPVISDTGVVVSGVRTSGCLNEQLSISWRINQVQQRRREGGVPCLERPFGLLSSIVQILLSCCTRKSPRQKFNLKSDAVLLQTAGLTAPTFITDSQYGCRSGTSNASVLHTLHWLTYFPLVSVAACWNTGCILLQTPHPASVYNTDEAGYCTGKAPGRREEKDLRSVF